MTKSSWDDAIAALSRRPETTGLLLDFDGTLTPVVKDPSTAHLSSEEINLLNRLARKLHTVAVVSGRPGTFLADRLALAPGVGSHLRAYGRGGLDAVDEQGNITRDTTLDRWLPKMRELADAARAAAPEAMIEDKGIIVTLHWRLAPQAEQRLRDFAQKAAAEHGLLIREGKMSIECFPPGTATKETAVSNLSKGCTAVAYFGDDFGDLDGFSALDHLDDGVETVRVGVRGEDVPSELIERADLVLDGPSVTIRFLNQLAAVLAA